MRARSRVAGVVLLALASTAAAAGPASVPEELVRTTVDGAFAVLKDKSLAGRERRAQRIASLRQVADRAFDWAEMARSSLGVKWRTLDGAQRTRFVDVFKDVLASQYLDDIDRFRGTETVTVDGSTAQGEEIVVRTTLVTAGHDRVPIEYRMRQQNGHWLAVDLSIEGVSLVNHFRRTFSDALANMTIAQLIERLQAQLPAGAPAR